MPDVALQAELSELWSCFSLVEGAHISEGGVRSAPLRARRCAALLQQAVRNAGLTGQPEVLERSLQVLFGSLEAHSRASLEMLATNHPIGACTPSARSLFLCAVLLLHGALIAAPPPVVAEHASAALCALGRLSLGAVVVPPLVELEEAIMTQL